MQTEEISEEELKKLNAPLLDPNWKNQADEDFLNLLMKHLHEGEIDLYRPSTLINFEVYDKLPPEAQGKIDMEAMNLLSAMREMKDLFDNGFLHSFQMENLVQRIRQTKERLETEGGDIFII